MWYPMFIPFSLIQLTIIAAIIGVIYVVITSIKMPLEYYKIQAKRREMLMEKLRKMDEEIVEDEMEEQKDSEIGS